jgi:hypothetical protein
MIFQKCYLETQKKKNHDPPRILFGDIMYNDDICKYLNLQYNAKENDDLKNVKIRMYVYIYTYVYIYIYACDMCIYIYVCVCLCVCIYIDI